MHAPTPNTHSGFSDGTARVVRQLMDQGRPAIHIPAIIDSSWVDTPAAALQYSTAVETLTVHRASAPAPWTERSFAYRWSIATRFSHPRWISGDDYVAGDSIPVHRALTLIEVAALWSLP